MNYRKDKYIQFIVVYYNKKIYEYIIVRRFRRFLIKIKLKLEKLSVVIIEKE